MSVPNCYKYLLIHFKTRSQFKFKKPNKGPAMEEEVQPSFWQPPATITWRSVRRRPVLHSSLVIIIVPSLSLLFIIFVLLPSITPKIVPTPNSPLNSKAVSVKRSWDSVNMVLVVFAILCGVFAPQNDDALTPENQEERINGGGGAVLQSGGKSERRSGPNAPHWGGYAEQRIYSPTSTPVTGIFRLRRTVSELPHSPQQYEWDAGNDRLRFFDDFEINKFYQSDHHPHHHYQFVYPEMNRIEPENNRVEPNDNRSEPDDDGGSVKEIPVDTFVLETTGELPSPNITPPSPPASAPHAPPPTPPPPPPPPPLSNQRTFETIRPRVAPHAPPPENRSGPKRTFHSTHGEERANHAPPPPPTPPPPPRLPPLSQGGWGEKKKRSSRKRMNATKEIATAIASFYNHRKRKRKQTSKPNYEDRTSPPSMAERTPPPAPPPPPPPTPPSVFHSLFRKGSKRKSNSKKVHSLSYSMPAPPPPPPNSDRKPPLPPRAIIDLFDREESLPNSGNQSPLTPIPRRPPPPPPPPPPMREGGYDRVRGEVPDGEGEELRSGEIDGGDEERETESVSVSSSTMGTACPSPDVNAKADTFIARHHHGWKLEKLNSWREKRNVGPPPGPTQGPFFEERAHLSVFSN